MSIWPAKLHFLVFWITPCFSLPFAVWKFCWKKRFRPCVLTNTARSARFFSETLRILAADGITDFGIALAKHCNLVSCSFVLQIDWLKPFLTGHAITCDVNGLTSFICLLWCNKMMVTTARRVRFHHTLPFITKQRVAVRLRLPPDGIEVTESLIPNSNHSRTSFITLIATFTRHLCSRRDAQVDELYPCQKNDY